MHRTFRKITYNRMRKIILQKEKSLFIPSRPHSITISSVIRYILEVYSISSSLKKKKKEKERKEKKNKKKGWKEFVRKKRKKGE